MSVHSEEKEEKLEDEGAGEPMSKKTHKIMTKKVILKKLSST